MRCKIAELKLLKRKKVYQITGQNKTERAIIRGKKYSTNFYHKTLHVHSNVYFERKMRGVEQNTAQK